MKIAAYMFDDFVLDVDAQYVTYRDHPVRITPKATQILFVLLRDHGQVVEKERFLKEVWPDTFVEESTLAQNILTLRKAFAKFNKVKEFIVTVPRRGYRFVGNVEEVSSSENARLIPVQRDETGLSRPVRSRIDPGVYHLIMDVESGVQRLWKVSMNGADAVLLTGRATRAVKMSPDGKRLACSLWDSKTDRMVLALVSAETGEVITYPAIPRNDDIPFLDWSSDGNNLYAVLRRAKPVSLWRIPLNGDQPVQLREWREELNLRLTISAEGQQIFYEVGAN